MPVAPRAIASVSISFGLVAIPVKVYSSTLTSEHISFHLVRTKDGSRVKLQYVAVNDGKVVDRSQLTKAYEMSKGKQVVFSADELKSFEEHTTHTIDIHQFAPRDSIDPVYFHGSFYLAPDKGGAKPYALLAGALEHTAQCALGRWVSHGKESVVAIRPAGQILALHQLRFHDEVRKIGDLKFEHPKISESELTLAEQLIKQLSVKRFTPEEYANEFKQRVDTAIRNKTAGREFRIEEAAAATGGDNVIDLMSALKASLGGKLTAASKSRGTRAASHRRRRRA
ncbi:MAG TPA: Ku protein [Steroidobacteraceae bacterium]|jgi:DNA end-binding protein Ku